MSKVLAKDYTMNIRHEMSTDSQIVGQLKKGSEMALKGFTKKDDYTWLEVEDGYIAYLEGVYVHLDTLDGSIDKKEKINQWLDASLESTKAGIEELKEMIK